MLKTTEQPPSSLGAWKNEEMDGVCRPQGLLVNPVTETVLRRRSVREGFSSATVPPEIVEEIVQCGLSAPSSKNARPWRFHVVTSRALLDDLADEVDSAEDIQTYVPFDPVTGQPRPEYSSTVRESAAVLRAVPLAVFVENRGIFSHGRSALVKAEKEALAASITGYMLEVAGVGAAVENMWIAAASHGLAGVFMGDVLVAEAAIQRRLSIESDLVGALALGYPLPDSPPPPKEPSRLDDDNVRWH
jgi:nitroreductase